jgi:hypothetical protein
MVILACAPRRPRPLASSPGARLPGRRTRSRPIDTCALIVLAGIALAHMAAANRAAWVVGNLSIEMPDLDKRRIEITGDIPLDRPDGDRIVKFEIVRAAHHCPLLHEFHS